VFLSCCHTRDKIKLVYSILLIYSSSKLLSIFPGAFGVPLDVCARSIYYAIKAIVKNVSNLSLREIHLVSCDPATTAIIQTVIRQLLENDFQLESGQKHGDDDGLSHQFDKLEVDESDDKVNVKVESGGDNGMDLESGDEEIETGRSMPSSLVSDHGIHQKDEFHNSVSQISTGQPVRGVVIEEHTRSQQTGVTLTHNAITEYRDEEELHKRSRQQFNETESDREVAATTNDHLYRTLSPQPADEFQLISLGGTCLRVDNTITASRDQSYRSLADTSCSLVGEEQLVCSTTVRDGHIVDNEELSTNCQLEPYEL